jgi:hypothetical protein
MRMLQHTVAVNINQDGFKSLVESLSEKGHTPLSAHIGMWLATEVGTIFEYQLVDGQTTSGAYNDTTKSDIFLSDNGFVIIEFSIKTPPQRGRFFGLMRQNKEVKLQFYSFGATIAVANQLLMKMCISAYHVLGLQPSDPSMFSEGSRYFIARQAEHNSKFLTSMKDGTRFVSANYDGGDLSVALRMTDKRTRDFICRLAQSKNFSENRFDEEISTIDESETLSDLLVEGGFVRRETVVQCRKSSQTIAHFDGNTVDLSALGMRCGTCNRLYQDEIIYSALLCTDKLIHLLHSSHWMTVLISSFLVEQGIPLEFIFWNITFGADEIDIIAFIDGSAWAFELKDTEFSSSDAHHFNYRRSIIKPEEALVISTTLVSPDAKRVFNDVSGPTPGATFISESGKLPMPILVEGLDNARNIIAEHLSSRSKAGLTWRIRNAFAGINSNIADILAERYERAS